MSIASLSRTVRTRLLRVTESISFLSPLLIRVTVGVVFIVTGWGKLHALDDVTAFFTSLNIPWPALNARVVAATEFFGGILILIGLGSRLVALPLAFTMVIAIVTAKRAEVDGFSTLVGFQEWSYLVMFLVIAIAGPGKLSLDALLARRLAATAGRNELPTPLLHRSEVSRPGG